MASVRFIVTTQKTPWRCVVRAALAEALVDGYPPAAATGSGRPHPATYRR